MCRWESISVANHPCIHISASRGSVISASLLIYFSMPGGGGERGYLDGLLVERMTACLTCVRVEGIGMWWSRLIP